MGADLVGRGMEMEVVDEAGRERGREVEVAVGVGREAVGVALGVTGNSALCLHFVN